MPNKLTHNELRDTFKQFLINKLPKEGVKVKAEFSAPIGIIDLAVLSYLPPFRYLPLLACEVEMLWSLRSRTQHIPQILCDFMKMSLLSPARMLFLCENEYAAREIGEIIRHLEVIHRYPYTFVAYWKKDKPCLVTNQNLFLRKFIFKSEKEENKINSLKRLSRGNHAQILITDGASKQ